MTRILFKNAMILTLDSQSRFYKSADLIVNDRKIESINKHPSGRFTRTIDASHLLLMPGLVNAHTHTPMTLLRGLKDDCPLDQWLSQTIWPAEDEMTRHDCYLGSLLGIAEALSTGTTSITDMYRHSSEIARAAAESGINANICESITCKDSFSPEDHTGVRECLSVWDTWNGHDNGRIHCDTSIQSLWQTSPGLWEYIACIAKDRHMGIHIHCAETKDEIQYCISHYGASPVSLLERAAVLQNRTILVHGIYMSERDLQLISAHNASVVHDPASNLKCCCGFANLEHFKEYNIPVALATDGVCSNNSGDMFETIRLTGLVQKMLNNNPAAAPAEYLLRAAVQNGLRTQGREKETGMLVPGMDADIIALNLDIPGMIPLYHPESALAYSASGHIVRMTMVRGKILYENGDFFTIDIERLRYEISQISKRLSHFA